MTWGCSNLSLAKLNKGNLTPCEQEYHNGQNTGQARQGSKYGDQQSRSSHDGTLTKTQYSKFSHDEYMDAV